jgi:hypothetical protein
MYSLIHFAIKGTKETVTHKVVMSVFVSPGSLSPLITPPPMSHSTTNLLPVTIDRFAFLEFSISWNIYCVLFFGLVPFMQNHYVYNYSSHCVSILVSYSWIVFSYKISYHTFSFIPCLVGIWLLLVFVYCRECDLNAQVQALVWHRFPSALEEHLAWNTGSYSNPVLTFRGIAGLLSNDGTIFIFLSGVSVFPSFKKKIEKTQNCIGSEKYKFPFIPSPF